MVFIMRNLFLTIIALICACGIASAQDDVQKAAQEAAEAFASAPVQKAAPKKPNYWTNSLTTQINVGQTSLSNWAAGGDNTFTLKGYADGNANWKKDKMFWNNRLQLEFGLLYASSKPLFQKSNDRIYLESKWGHRIHEQLYASANFDFKSQFANGYDYKTPSAAQVKEWFGTDATLEGLSKKDQTKAWQNARKPKSGCLSPAYTTLALGLDWNPANWVSVSFAPLTGGFTVVTDSQFRKAYGMKLTKEYENTKDDYAALKTKFPTVLEEADYNALSAEDKAAYDTKTRYDNAYKSGTAYRSALFQFGAQLKMDFKVNVNDNFKYTSQIVLFTDYLSKKDNGKYNPNVRFNWDNKFDWKLAKYFALTVTTNMIYDTNVFKPKTEKGVEVKDESGQTVMVKRGLQFAESISFGFTYTIASKSK